jgi:hypothetical protein
MAHSLHLTRDFDHILTHIDDEDYDRCTLAALHFIRTYRGPEAMPYRPYAEFFKLFADSYHAWQGSYHYTPIRAGFRLAASCLQNAPRAEDHHSVVEALRTLCEMLLEYTWCENSAINNDPFALEDHSRKAVDLDDQGHACLADFSTNEPHLKKIADWLRRYFSKNRSLHAGLNACAIIYARIMQDRRCPEDLFREQMAIAEKALASLTSLSPELSSELNAHVRHVSRHYERISKPSAPPTFLRVRSGKLVLSLSAACDRTAVRRILESDWGEAFEPNVEEQLGKLGLKIKDDSCRYTQLLDIFETSFGETFLKSLTFDIEPDPVELNFLGNRTFSFRPNVTLSALGTCTVAFELKIDEQEFKNGLSVEEIRVLESCICPHAGQIKIVFERLGKPLATPVRFFDRVNTARLAQSIDELKNRVADGSDALLSKKLSDVSVELERYRDHILTADQGITAEDREHRCIELCNTLNHVITSEHQADLKELILCCHDHTRLSGLAEEILGAIERAFRVTIRQKMRDKHHSNQDEVLWLLRSDLGWYSYLYAKRIDEVTTSLQSLREEAVSFDGIQDHPDTLGLVIDQREARASFDDWRFMALSVSQKDNLAHVRSHRSDAFYTSEFQSFFYFPDDPQYLVDQYEETVKLNLRLNVGLRFYNLMAEKLTFQIRQHEAIDGRKINWLKRAWYWVRNIRIELLKRDLERVKRLRAEANELRNLVLKAGISRYQDHGQLMKRILEETNIEAAAVITDRHLAQLEELGREIIEQLRDSRTRWFTRGFVVVGCLFGASVTKDFFDAWLHRHTEPWTFIGMASVLVASILIGLILGRPPSEK